MDETTSSEIVVIGSANIDFIMKMDRLPRVGEPITNATFSQALGGKGANQAVAAACSSKGAEAGAPAGGHVSFVASVGNDQYAADMLSSWAGSGLETSHVSRADGHTGSALIMIGEGGTNYISAAPAANDKLLPEHIDSFQSILRAARYILIQFEIPEITTERILELAARCKRVGGTFTLLWHNTSLRGPRLHWGKAYREALAELRAMSGSNNS